MILSVSLSLSLIGDLPEVLSSALRSQKIDAPRAEYRSLDFFTKLAALILVSRLSADLSLSLSLLL